MAVDVTFENVYMTYIENKPYIYPSKDTELIITGSQAHSQTIQTGWHVVPNFLWRHFVTPKQWAQLVIGYEAYKVKGMKCILYNPIPITSNLSLQRINTFAAFNNCTYGLTYTDRAYETSWYPWNLLTPQYQLNLGQREGMIYYGPANNDEAAATARTRYIWPEYYWIKPRATNLFEWAWSQGKGNSSGIFDNLQTANTQGDTDNVALPNGVFWDPYNLPDEIGEFRAGKNSIEFDWHTHECDSGKWFNIDQMASFSHWTARGPYCGVGRPSTHIITSGMDPEPITTWGQAQRQSIRDQAGYYLFDDYTVPNMANMPLCQTTWFWKEIQQSIVEIDEAITDNNATSYPSARWRKPDKWFPGTEYESYKYPPWQWFCKGIPLFDAQNEHIKTTTHVSVRVSLYLECKKRRSAYYCPTWGPMSGEQLYYMAHSRQIYQPDMIRYRTAGARNTWQNIQRPRSRNMTEGQNANWQKEHPREDPYNVVPTGDAQFLYNNLHRPAGIPDATSRATASTRATTEAKRPAKRNIRVTFNAKTDKSEIIMEDSDEN